MKIIKIFFIFAALSTALKSNSAQQYYKYLEALEADNAADRFFVTEGAEQEFNREQIFISLGRSCECAYQMSKHNAGGAFFPFDWMFTQDFNGICEVINNNFKTFLDSKNLNKLPEKVGNCYVIQDVRRSMKFVHDFPVGQSWKVSYNAIKEKYARRIARFERAMIAGKPVVFFRRCITKAQAQSFVQMLLHKYPALQFTLIAIGEGDAFATPWGIPHVRNMLYIALVKKYEDSWQGNHAWWDGLFASLSV